MAARPSARSYDGRLRYFLGEETLPLGTARNLAVQQAQGDLVVSWTAMTPRSPTRWNDRSRSWRALNTPLRMAGT